MDSFGFEKETTGLAQSNTAKNSVAGLPQGWSRERKGALSNEVFSIR
jgi:hypothetical protein